MKRQASHGWQCFSDLGLSPGAWVDFMTSKNTQEPTDGDEAERFAFVGVAFGVGLAMLTVPLALNGYSALQGARSDGSPGVLFAWLVFWCLAIFPAVIAFASVIAVFKLMFMLHLRHSPSIPIQLLLSAGLLYGAYRIGY